ncbi:MAG: histidine kinase [Herminiimonas sp.]|nr:histidine kinase [Herminiimonas sp.]MDB5852389.1 histidine kinase [Herminiimonas sp.]
METSSFNAQAFVDAAGDAIIGADAKGAITFWNAAAERIFGHTPQEALGQSLDIIIPERQRQRHWDGFDGTMESGRTKYGASLLRVPALHKSGRTISIAFTVTLLRTEGGAMAGIVAIVRDESERWEEERNLRQKLKDLEARTSGAAG